MNTFKSSTIVYVYSKSQNTLTLFIIHSSSTSTSILFFHKDHYLSLFKNIYVKNLFFTQTFKSNTF